MKKVIQFFIPATIPDDPEQQRKARLTVSVLLIIIYFNLNYSLVSYLIGFSGGIYSQVPLMVIGLVILWLYRAGVTPWVLYAVYFFNCSVSIAVTVYYTGGFLSVIFPWLASTPIVAVLVWSRRGGFFSMLVVLSIISWFYYLYQDNFAFPVQIRSQYQHVFNLVCCLGLPLILFLISIVFENARNSALRRLNATMVELEAEKDRSTSLLLNILPEEIANELKQYGRAQAKLFDSVTVLFTDFKGFTEASSHMSPDALLDEINVNFSAFDRIIRDHGLEKIKTIGDAYMAVAGLPTPMEDHALAAVRAARAICAFVDQRVQERKARQETYFEIRIGVHSGPVMAGIVGDLKFQYDVWGDTVNTASRMESSGVVGAVNISQPTYELVRDTVDCLYRGKVPAKGKGDIDMYLVQ
ncbi:MAG TPA: adenylate/guanylate cyclase domain-containing protein [Chitinophagaceae bacterium]|nr:adenylate/guanylate cyclase domain-containing protein [Chitinophagaceae bacterium]